MMSIWLRLFWIVNLKDENPWAQGLLGGVTQDQDLRKNIIRCTYFRGDLEFLHSIVWTTTLNRPCRGLDAIWDLDADLNICDHDTL